MKPVAAPNSAIHSSLGLAALMQSLSRDLKYSILDLGPAIGQNVDFWSQLRCKLYLADLYHELASGPTPDPEEESAPDKLFESQLDFESGTLFDIVLMWDLLNYLPHSQVESLVRRLTPHCSNGALVFMLISTRPRIPAYPNTYRIIDEQRILYESHTVDERDCPRYLPRDVGMIMEGFSVADSFLLRHGIQEYLFAYRGRSVAAS